MSPDEQIKRLQKLARFSWIPSGLVVLTLAFLVFGYQSGYEALFVLGAFVGFAAVASRKVAPHWRNAIQATRAGTRLKGVVTILITRDPTSFDDYVATVEDESKNTWRFQFSPHYWEPTEGTYSAETYYVQGVEWPVLLLTEGGIVFPAFIPQKIAKPAESSLR
ncbi:MAG: hypothetical protein PHY62_04985 [Gallionella sp.]|nr:hypothetical protein [Gallionella sp.]